MFDPLAIVWMMDVDSNVNLVFSCVIKDPLIPENYDN